MAQSALLVPEIRRHAGCTPFPVRSGEATMLHDFLVALFAIAAGFTASGIIANTYRLLATKPENAAARMGYLAVMVVAGPSVLFENATKAWRASECSSGAFWIAAAVCGYWSLALGLVILGVAVSI